jgi:molybdopterin/thiamine biosynthesis adenylyltransferase
MSQLQINLSQDLKQLRDEGYNIRIVSNHLVVEDVPYVTSQKEVKFGMLVSDLTLAGNITAKPENHVIHFGGECPCNSTGQPLKQIIMEGESAKNFGSVNTQYSFSSRPIDGYKDYYHKITTYIGILCTQAQLLNSEVTAQSYSVVESEDKDSVFKYIDTASSRISIADTSAKLAQGPVAILGLGGTGSYILDLVAKTLVPDIHLIDGDKYLQHNAFRSPGAPSIEELRKQPFKVDYFAAKYSNIHRKIHAHAVFINESNLDLLDGMSFVFVCIDKGKIKRLIFDKLEKAGIPFIDVGMGIHLVDGALHGIVRTTYSDTEKRVQAKNCVSQTDDVFDNEYDSNIQVADLNALNAAFAVIKWKRHCGFYHDIEKEYNSLYTIDGNNMCNED